MCDKKECCCKKHPHAELMMQYAQDAMETDKPWERWQFCSLDGIWGDCKFHPRWNKYYKYRRKPRTININGYEVPEPLRTSPCVGTDVYYPSLDGHGLVARNKFVDNTFNNLRLKRGLLHLTKEAAEMHAKALLSFTRGIMYD